jgi:hypothetical protein
MGSAVFQLARNKMIELATTKTKGENRKHKDIRRLKAAGYQAKSIKGTLLITVKNKIRNHFEGVHGLKIQ